MSSVASNGSNRAWARPHHQRPLHDVRVGETLIVADIETIEGVAPEPTQFSFRHRAIVIAVGPREHADDLPAHGCAEPAGVIANDNST